MTFAPDNADREAIQLVLHDFLNAGLSMGEASDSVLAALAAEGRVIDRMRNENRVLVKRFVQEQVRANESMKDAEQWYASLCDACTKRAQAEADLAAMRENVVLALTHRHTWKINPEVCLGGNVHLAIQELTRDRDAWRAKAEGKGT